LEWARIANPRHIVLNVKLPIPAQIESVLGKKKVSTKIKTYEQFKAFLG
jgi:threonine synthase